MNARRLFAFACGVALSLGVVSWRARADQWDKKTILTVSNNPVQITDRVLLEPGQYVLKLLNSDSNRHVVQIFDRDQQHIINTVIAVPAYRQEVTGRTELRFWETPPGYAKALRAWYYPGDNYGQEFPYPKQLAALTTQTTAQNQQSTTTTEEQQQQAETTPPPAAQEEEQKQESTEMAQSTPPPQPEQQTETPAPAPAPAPEAKPERLPQTATPYPTIGLAGASLLFLYGLLRFRRLA